MTVTDEEEGPMRPAYEQIADDIRRAIERSEYAPGAQLPSAKALAKQHGCSQETALKALRHLATQGHIELRHRVGAFVRDVPAVRLVVRDRHVYRDALGYFFDENAKNWRAVGSPTRELRVPPPHVAQILGLENGQDALVRDRGMGPDSDGPALQLATSYLPLSEVNEIPALGNERTGPGGIYDRIEEHYDRPISWRESVSVRLPDSEEQQRLRIPPTVPLLVVTRESRVARGGREAVVEVNETRMSGERFSLAYDVQRDATAAWPREERP